MISPLEGEMSRSDRGGYVSPISIELTGKQDATPLLHKLQHPHHALLSPHRLNPPQPRGIHQPVRPPICMLSVLVSV